IDLMKKAKTKNFSLPTSAASRHTTPLRGYFLSSRFICEATNHSSSRFCYEATGPDGGQELSNACGARRYPWAVWIVSVNLHSCLKALAILTIQIDLDCWCALTTLNRSLGD